MAVELIGHRKYLELTIPQMREALKKVVAWKSQHFDIVLEYDYVIRETYGKNGVFGLNLKTREGWAKVTWMNETWFEEAGVEF